MSLQTSVPSSVQTATRERPAQIMPLPDTTGGTDRAAALVPMSNPVASTLSAALTNPLSAEHTSKAAALARVLENGGLDAIHGFGREIGKHTAAYTDELLAQIRSGDLDAMGTKLSQIVGVAQSLNLTALTGKRSSLPMIGPLIDRLRLKAGDFGRKFQDVRGQIDTLVGEVDTMQTGLAQRIESLSEAFASIQEEHALLQIHITAGDSAKIGMQKRLAQMPKNPPDAMQAQQQQDAQAAVAVLDKRIADMRVLQHAALQQLPMIRMVQNNNRMLIDKFHSIRELTVPAWKRQFMLALSLNEQKKAVELANTIDDATNAFLIENARLLKDNTIATAKANQRLVIDVATLKEVHDTLLSTVQEVLQINRDGVRQRADATGQLKSLRQSMVQQLTARAD